MTMRHVTWMRRLALAGLLLGLGVVVFGAYVRLTYAGLGCPDWPGCFGHVTPLGAHDANAGTADTPLHLGKAWREMIHRYAASVLGLIIVAITALSLRWRGAAPQPRQRGAAPLDTPPKAERPLETDSRAGARSGGRGGAALPRGLGQGERPVGEGGDGVTPAPPSTTASPAARHAAPGPLAGARPGPWPGPAARLRCLPGRGSLLFGYQGLRKRQNSGFPEECCCRSRICAMSTSTDEYPIQRVFTMMARSCVEKSNPLYYAVK